MYYSYVEIEYVATSFSPARMDSAVKLFMNSTLTFFCNENNKFQVKEQGDEKGMDVLKD
jgi:hypothetical protein